MTNPYADRWRTFKNGERYEDRMLELEARLAEAEPTYDCNEKNCNGTCYYRPGVGGFWCGECGELLG